MPSNIQQAISLEIDDLVLRVEKLAQTASQARSSLGAEAITELSSLAARSGQLIRKLYGMNSQYNESLQKVISTDNFTTIHSHYYAHLSELAGILKGVQHELKAGLLVDIRRLLQADIFGDFLKMSEYLLAEGYKDAAAAVLLGAVLEDSLKKLADSNKIPTIALRSC